jgi:hypothetical protein
VRYLVNTDDPGLRAQYGRPAFQVVASPGGHATQLVGFNQAVTDSDVRAASFGIAAAVTVLGVVGAAYHGYRRNDSMGWAAAWATWGLFFPVPTLAYAAGQGFAKPA